MPLNFATSRTESAHGSLLLYSQPLARNLRELLELSRHVPEDRAYLIQDDRVLTFGELLPAVGGVSQFLMDEAGMQSGDRVAIAAANCIEWALTAWAATVNGAIAVGLNAWWHPEEAVAALELTSPRILVVDVHYFSLLEPYLASVRSLESIIMIGEAPETSHTFRPFPNERRGALPPVAEIDPDSVATLLFTSGTTGPAKAVQGTHRNACSTFQNTLWMDAEYFPGVALRSLESSDPPCTVLSAPMFHVAGLQWGFMFPAASGTTVVLNTGRYRAEKALGLAIESRATSLGGVPTTLMRILDLPDLPDRDLSHIVSVSWGGAPAPAELAQRCVDTFPRLAFVGTGYGLTETCGLGLYMAGTDLLRHPTAAGRTLPCVEVRIVLPDGTPAPSTVEGEVQLRGPIVMTGYWTNPEATAKVLAPDGWFSTGDLGFLNDESLLFLTGRIKEIIIRGGENIHPVEIEDVLRSYPGVLDAGVAGRQHPTLGEEVVAYVQSGSQTKPTEAELQEHVRQHLAGFKVPSAISVGEDVVPRNAAGKILRDAIAGQGLRFTEVL